MKVLQVPWICTCATVAQCLHMVLASYYLNAFCPHFSSSRYWNILKLWTEKYCICEARKEKRKVLKGMMSSGNYEVFDNTPECSIMVRGDFYMGLSQIYRDAHGHILINLVVRFKSFSLSPLRFQSIYIEHLRTLNNAKLLWDFKKLIEHKLQNHFLIFFEKSKSNMSRREFDQYSMHTIYLNFLTLWSLLCQCKARIC